MAGPVVNHCPLIIHWLHKWDRPPVTECWTDQMKARVEHSAGQWWLLNNRVKSFKPRANEWWSARLRRWRWSGGRGGGEGGADRSDFGSGLSGVCGVKALTSDSGLDCSASITQSRLRANTIHTSDGMALPVARFVSDREVWVIKSIKLIITANQIISQQSMLKRRHFANGSHTHCTDTNRQTDTDRHCDTLTDRFTTPPTKPSQTAPLDSRHLTGTVPLWLTTADRSPVSDSRQWLWPIDPTSDWVVTEWWQRVFIEFTE